MAVNDPEAKEGIMVDDQTDAEIQRIQQERHDQAITEHHHALDLMFQKYGLSGHQRTGKPLWTRARYKATIRALIGQRNILRSAILTALPHVTDPDAAQDLRGALTITEDDPCTSL